MPLTPDALALTGSVHRIAPEVWRIVAPNPGPLTGPGTNTYLVGAEAPLVIDPGPDDAAHLRRIVELAGSRPSGILCTHSHPDHSPGAAWLAATTGARVHGRPAPDDGHQDPGYSPQTGLDDGELLSSGTQRLRVLHTPGHASNHVCFLLEDERLLFTGDHLMQGTTVVLIPPDGSLRDYLASLRRLAGLPIDALAPGHGKRIPDASAEIERVIRHRLQRESRLLAVLQRLGPSTLERLLPEVYDDVPAQLHPVARYSLLAHLIRLVEDRRVEEAGDVYRWTAG